MGKAMARLYMNHATLLLEVSVFWCGVKVMGVSDTIDYRLGASYFRPSHHRGYHARLLWLKVWTLAAQSSMRCRGRQESLDSRNSVGIEVAPSGP